MKFLHVHLVHLRQFPAIISSFRSCLMWIGSTLFVKNYPSAEKNVKVGELFPFWTPCFDTLQSYVHLFMSRGLILSGAPLALQPHHQHWVLYKCCPIGSSVPRLGLSTGRIIQWVPGGEFLCLGAENLWTGGTEQRVGQWVDQTQEECEDGSKGSHEIQTPSWALLPDTGQLGSVAAESLA